MAPQMQMTELRLDGPLGELAKASEKATPQRKRILFVDDEPNVLKALQRMLYGMRREWEMRFVTSGEEALAELGRERYHVVVTDMRMPGMDGAELLARVREEFPRVVRLVLSGQSGRETILRAIPSTHQFLSKPCEAERLKATITRSCELHNLVPSDALLEVFYVINALPCLRASRDRLKAQIGDPEATIEQISQTIGRDQSMAAKVLQLVNSPFFGNAELVANPAQAAMMLGLDTIRALVEDVRLFDETIGDAFSDEEQRAFQLHTQVASALARRIARDLGGDETTQGHAATAGLLHDVGRLAVNDRMARFDRELIGLARHAGLALWQVEKSWFGASHAEIGACLLELWGIPRPIADAVAAHHNPSARGEASDVVVTAVHLAEILASRRVALTPSLTGTFDHAYLDPLGLEAQLAGWEAECDRIATRLARENVELTDAGAPATEN